MFSKWTTDKLYQYVIHKHRARRAGLHYDLRISTDNVSTLYSFATRKEPILKLGEKRLLIKQPDHEKWWLDFEGEIKSGYGAGTLEIWDKGKVKVLKNEKNVAILDFDGNKLRGLYAIVKSDYDNNDKYLFIRMKKQTLSEDNNPFINSLIARYRYTIRMPDRYKEVTKLINDWSTEKFNQLYNGKLCYLVSPFYDVKDDNNKLVVQIQLDLDKRDLNANWDILIQLRRKYPWLYAEYTGKTGFHMYSNFMILVDKDDYTIIRDNILSNLKLPSGIDIYSSLRNMPTVRIGYRDDSQTLAFPIFVYSKRWLKNIIDNKYNDFRFVKREKLRDYISNRLIPYNNIISWDEFISKGK